MRIAIIGAGMAGLTCARALADGGLKPVVFEKSRGLGGRLATRRAGEFHFDHGAPSVDAEGESFQRYLDSHGARYAPDGVEDAGYVGVPGMNALVKPMADGLDIRLGEKVSPQRDGGCWLVGSEKFDRVVSTAPVPQARAMYPEMANGLAAVEVAPCWTLMMAFEDAPDWAEVSRAPESNLALIARNASKPQRATEIETWVVHAEPEWSTTHLELDKDVAQEHLLDLLRGARGGLPPIEYVTAHRWRYAQTRVPLGRSHIASADGSLLIGGDWCLGARAEEAWNSGRAMAEALLNASTMEQNSG